MLSRMAPVLAARFRERLPAIKIRLEGGQCCSNKDVAEDGDLFKDEGSKYSQ
jgi:hypothetical protein